MTEASINLSPPQVELPSQAADSTSSTDSTDSTDEPPSDAADEQPLEIALPVVLPLVVNEPELITVIDDLKVVVDLPKIEPQPKVELTELTPEQAAQKQFYQDLWQKLSKDVVKPTQPEVLIAVAKIALGRKYSPDQVVQIVGQSPTIQKVLRDKGRDVAVETTKEIVTQAYERGRDRANQQTKPRDQGGR